MSEVYNIKNALLSVYSKEGIVQMAGLLNDCGINILSSGGTAKKLNEGGIPAMDVAEYVGFPPLFDHRVVTLHPKVHGGILYRRDNEQDCEEAKKQGIIDIGLVVVNMCPVQKAIEENSKLEDVVKLIDIGGPALIRAAAKNHKYVSVVVDPSDYIPVAEEIKNNGGLPSSRRFELAQKAFETTAEYDRSIAEFYKNHTKK